jgi:hypothetical protein
MKNWRTERAEELKVNQKRYLIKKKYGITLEEWELLFENQGRVCKICGTSESGKHDWNTDHCHESKKVRGILCNKCNLLLGHAKDDIEILFKAIEYLKENS